MQTDPLISARRTDQVIVKKKKKKRNFRIVDFAVPADHRVKINESEKRDKYLELTKEHEGDSSERPSTHAGVKNS